MQSDFHKDMNKYLAKRKRKGLFSNIKFSVTSNKEGTGKEITQEDIERLVRGKDIKIGPKEEIGSIEEEKDSGWKEVNLEELQGEEAGLDKEKRLAKLGNENLKGEKTESEEDKSRRLEMEEGIKVLKEKQRIEEDRLTELRRARRMEQMEALRARVTDILFGRKPAARKDMGEEVRGEIRREAKIKEAEKQKVEAKEAEKPKKEVTKAEETKEEPKKSFFSSFIQIRTATEIAREEEERLKKEEEQAIKEQMEANKILQQDTEEVKTNMPANVQSEEQKIDFSTLFAEEAKTNAPDNIQPEEKTADFSTLFAEEKETIQGQIQNSGSEIELDKTYKIKVVKN